MTATPEQVQQRFVTVPAPLQDALFSVENTEIIASLQDQYHVSDEKIGTVASLVGWVLLGFLSKDELADEIAADGELDSVTAKKIAATLTEKIFNPLQAVINAVYRPASTDNQSAPKIIRDIASAKNSIPAPNPKTGIPAPAPLNDLSSKGWSHMSPTGASMAPEGPTSFSTIPVPSKPPTPITAPKPTQTSPAPAPAPAPVMIQQGERFTAPARNADFHIERKMAAQVNLENVKIQPKAKPAVIEFGQAQTKSARFIQPKNTGSTHQGFMESLSSTPFTKSADRSVTEITAGTSIPKPPASPSAPKPPALPKPPMPPAPMAQIPKPPAPKVITKDFNQ